MAHVMVHVYHNTQEVAYWLLSCPHPVIAVAIAAQTSHMVLVRARIFMKHENEYFGMPCAGADDAASRLPAATDMQMQAALLQQSRCRLRAGKAQMMFEHIHKSGGTTMCMLAIRNSLPMWSCHDNSTTTAPPGSSDYGPHSMCNCNGPDVLRGARGPFQVSTPQQQLQLLQNYKGAVLFFNEGPVADEMLRSEAIQYVTLLRDPVQRYVSHLLHGLEHQGKEQYQRALQVRAECCRSDNCTPTMPPAPLDKDCINRAATSDRSSDQRTARYTA
jgi:hypothetical protein